MPRMTNAQLVDENIRLRAECDCLERALRLKHEELVHAQTDANSVAGRYDEEVRATGANLAWNTYGDAAVAQARRGPQPVKVYTDRFGVTWGKFYDTPGSKVATCRRLSH